MQLFQTAISKEDYNRKEKVFNGVNHAVVFGTQEYGRFRFIPEEETVYWWYPNKITEDGKQEVTNKLIERFHCKKIKHKSMLPASWMTTSWNLMQPETKIRKTGFGHCHMILNGD